MTPILAGIVASGISGHLTPPFTPTGSYDALATYTVPSGGVSSITFAGLPTGGQYSHLQIRGIARYTWAATGTGESYIQFNGDGGANYSYQYLWGNGSAVQAGAGGNVTESWAGWGVRNNSLANAYGGFVIDILDAFSTTKYKTVRSLGGADISGSGTVAMTSGLWRNANPINSFVLTPNGVGFAQYSQISVYGVK